MKFPKTVEEAIAVASNYETAGLTERQRGVIGTVVANDAKHDKGKDKCLASPQNVPKSPIVHSLLSHQNSDNWPIPGTGIEASSSPVTPIL